MSASESNIDQRHQKRIQLMQNLFAATFNRSQEYGRVEISRLQDLLPADETLQANIAEILDELTAIDQQLKQYAPERPLSEINLIDLAILRLIVWESINKNTPKKVLIDEAVEMAKEFGTESSPRFVNGVLGKLFTMDKTS